MNAHFSSADYIEPPRTIESEQALRRLGSGDPVVNLRIATSESWKDKQTGERKEKTEWHSVVIFNEHIAKVAESYLKKGTKVYLEGQLQTRKWQDQSGQEKYTTEIVLQRFRGELTILSDGRSSRDDDADDGGSVQRGGSANDTSQGDRRDFGSTSPMDRRPATGSRFGDIDDDIPF